jgi:uncharacterized protein (TIGR02001 family)
MRKTIVAASLASAALAVPSLAAAQAAAPAAAPAPTPEYTFTGNLGLVSDYRFRGISQTFKQPAIQGGFDFSHTASGIYLGNWNSNVNSGAGFPGGSIEMDFYGGWKHSWGDFGLDLGGIYYYYPGTDANITNFPANPRNLTKTHSGRVDNGELYVAGSWKWLSLKYSHAVTDYFSLPDTKGSNYIDFSGTYDLGDGWGIVGHVGWFNLKNWHNNTNATDGDYTDWKIGVTKDISGWVLGAAYIDTSAKGSCNLTNPGFYCFGNSASGATKFKDVSNSTIVFSVSKTF